jgi:hypothetical protein
MNHLEFDEFLKSSVVEPMLPKSFKSDVWRHIEHRKSDGMAGAGWVTAWLESLTRPWGAAVGIAAAVALGAGLGAARSPSPDDSRITYAQSINPFASNSHR